MPESKKKLQKSKDPKLENVLQGFKQVRDQKIAIIRPILKAKAEGFAKIKI